jgi:hypothetical protein
LQFYDGAVTGAVADVLADKNQCTASAARSYEQDAYQTEQPLMHLKFLTRPPASHDDRESFLCRRAQKIGAGKFLRRFAYR